MHLNSQCMLVPYDFKVSPADDLYRIIYEWMIKKNCIQFCLYAHSFTVVLVEYELDQTIPVCLFA